MPCSARATPMSLGLAFRKLAQARPTNRDAGCADASESHLRIPAEYHCRPREQRETGNNGRVGTKNGSYRVDTMKKKEEGEEKESEEEKEQRGWRRRREKKECIASSVSSCRSLTFSPRCPYFLQPHRCSQRPSSILASLGAIL